MKELTAEQKRDWLTATADAMEAAGEEHFDMEQWFRTPASSYHNLHDVDLFDISDCGTTACIAGWLTFTAPSDVKDGIARDVRPSHYVSNLLGIHPSAWFRDSWYDLYYEYGGPYDELYPCDDRSDYARAIAFLRAMADTCSN